MPVLKECRGHLGEDWSRVGGRDHRGRSGTAPAWGTAGSRACLSGSWGIHLCSHKLLLQFPPVMGLAKDNHKAECELCFSIPSVPTPISPGMTQLPHSHFELKMKGSSLLFFCFSIIFRVLPLESSMTM